MILDELFTQSFLGLLLRYLLFSFACYYDNNVRFTWLFSLWFLVDEIMSYLSFVLFCFYVIHFIISCFSLLRHTRVCLYCFSSFTLSLFLSLNFRLPSFLFYLVADVKPEKGLEKSDFVTIHAFGHGQLLPFSCWSHSG